MESLLEEQQKALQHALDLHRSMVSYILPNGGPSFQNHAPSLEFASRGASTSFDGLSSDTHLPKSHLSPEKELHPFTPRTKWDKFRQPLLQGDEGSEPCIAEASDLILHNIEEISATVDKPRQRGISAKSDKSGQRLEESTIVYDPRFRAKFSVHDESQAVFSKTKIGKVVRTMTKEFHDRRQMENDIAKQEFKDVDHYHQNGFWATWRNNAHWQNLVFTVILANTVYIAVDIDYNKAEILSDAKMPFQVASNFFCFFFFIEVVVRFCALKKIKFVRHDGWLLFDTVLVTLQVWETWIQVWLYQILNSGSGIGPDLKFFSILRLLRVFRLIRALHAVPELMILVCGMLSAIRSVLATVCLLVLTIYMFSAIFTQLLGGKELGIGSFDTVLQSMQLLLIQVLCGVDADFITQMYDLGIAYYCLCLMFLFLGQLTIMNMLIGVVCSAIEDTTQEIHDSVLEKEVAKNVREVLTQKSLNNTGYISKETVSILLDDPDIINMLYSMGIDLGGLKEFCHEIFLGVHEVEFNDMVDMVIQFRQEKAATVRDLSVMRRMLHLEFAALEDCLQKMGGLSRMSSQSEICDS